MNKTTSLIVITVVVMTLVVALLIWWLLPEPKEETVPEPIVVTEEVIAPVLSRKDKKIGESVEGRDIVAVTFGDGDQNLLFVGGIHGGYEWNSSLLAYEMIDHIEANPDMVPENLSVTIVPDLNPDGTFLVTGKEGRFFATDIADPGTRVAEARFNANGIDLNRNFACKWEPESTWRGNVVSAGTAAFSEPEAQALRSLVEEKNPQAVVFWHSQANNVYASECEDGVLPETLDVMSTYAAAGSYGEVPVFDVYPITGDAEGWLASIGIPAVTVELETYNSIEWSRNLAGTTAILEKYSVAK